MPLNLAYYYASLAKAGVVCTLPARTSILAAANPVGGHYSHAKTVSQNIKLGPALLSRFDLVYIMLDKPDVVLFYRNISNYNSENLTNKSFKERRQDSYGAHYGTAFQKKNSRIKKGVYLQ